jgi:hypothetical protein
MSLMCRFTGFSVHRPYRRKRHDDSSTVPSGAVPDRRCDHMQFFLADLYAERLAGTPDSADAVTAPAAAGPEQAVPSQDGQDDAPLLAAAAR